jgi:cytosine/adenosine deaminase-related metal-dependent hydrolase
MAALRGFEAPWLITGVPGEAPVREGAVVLDEQGRVLDVAAKQVVQAAHPGLVLKRESGILLPGLVNAHVHLELSALRGQTRSGGGFGPWVASMMQKRQELVPEQDLDAIDAGVSELLQSGTVAIGEVTNTLASVDALSSAPLLGRVFHEVFGMRRETARVMRGMAEQGRQAFGAWPAHLSYTLAPHTLYSLHPASVNELVETARAAHARTSLHLSEHAAERAFLRDGSGPFADFLRARKVDPADWDPPGLSPVSYARQLGVLGPDVIAVHLCATNREELLEVAQAGAPVVLCPRSNLFIELKLPPLYDILEVGLRPGLGTDSLASNTTLDVLAEAAALRDRFPQVDPGMLFSMACWYGAVALGLEHRVGALKAGLAPGLLAVDVTPGVTLDDPLKHILRSPPPKRRVLARPALPSAQRSLGDPA